MIVRKQTVVSGLHRIADHRRNSARGPKLKGWNHEEVSGNF